MKRKVKYLSTLLLFLFLYLPVVQAQENREADIYELIHQTVIDRTFALKVYKLDKAPVPPVRVFSDSLLQSLALHKVITSEDVQYMKEQLDQYKNFTWDQSKLNGVKVVRRLLHFGNDCWQSSIPMFSKDGKVAITYSFTNWGRDQYESIFLFVKNGSEWEYSMTLVGDTWKRNSNKK